MTPTEIAAAKAKLSPKALVIYTEILSLGGIETHRDMMRDPIAKELADLLTYGPARGPGGAWRRCWAVEDEEML